jgi:FkbM family methyltransferase
MDNILRVREHTFFDLPKEGVVIVDLGSSKGEFIEEMVNRYAIKKAVLVEAHPELCSDLLDRFGRVKEFKIYNNIVAATAGISHFNIDEKSPYNGSIMFTRKHLRKIYLNKITINEIIEENNLEKIDLLKVDIEGVEWDILPNFTKKEYDLVDQMTVEFHDFLDPKYRSKTKDAVDHLVGLGYKIKNTPNSYRYGSDYYDTLFYK